MTAQSNRYRLRSCDQDARIWMDGYTAGQAIVDGMRLYRGRRYSKVMGVLKSYLHEGSGIWIVASPGESYLVDFEDLRSGKIIAERYEATP